MVDLLPIPSPSEPLYYGEPGQPLVVILPDWYGRLPWLEAYAEAVSSRGLRVAVLDLYGGWATTSAEQAEVLMNELDLGATLALIDDVIAAERATGSQKVGTIGFSVGGWLALVHAEGGATDAVVSYYSSLSAADHGVIPAPVMLHFAETDTWEPGETPAEFIDRLKDHGTPVIEHTYLGTVHSFANATISSNVDARAAALAFARSVSFLENHLGE